MTDGDFTGPLSFAVFALPSHADIAGVTAEITRLAETHAAEILDVELIAVDQAGAVRIEQLPDSLAALRTDLLDAEDLDEIGSELAEGEQALVVVYEDRTLSALARQVVLSGGRELTAGGIDAADLDEVDDDEPGADAGALS